MLNLTMPDGGAREGAGRKSAYPGKVLDEAFYMDFTAAGREALAALQRSLGLSRNDILAHLALSRADDLSFEQAGVVFRGKLGRRDRSVMTIRLPETAGLKLRAARLRTGKSYSDLGEALVTRYGPIETFPPLPEGKRPRKPRRIKRVRTARR